MRAPRLRAVFSSKNTRNTNMTDTCTLPHHADHAHQHGANCGHTAIKHDGHVDYLHAVSYTHLDVYKRQTSPTPNIFPPKKKTAIPSRGRTSPSKARRKASRSTTPSPSTCTASSRTKAPSNRRKSPSTTPVSYTHLVSRIQPICWKGNSAK